MNFGPESKMTHDTMQFKRNIYYTEVTLMKIS
jgi:hypothetical protein